MYNVNRLSFVQYFAACGALGMLLWILNVAAPQDPKNKEAQEDDTADVPSQDLRCGKKEHQRYFLIGPKKDTKPPKDGFGLVVVLPGGDGSADFNKFIKRVWKYTVPEHYLFAELVSVKWTPKQELIWPTKSNDASKMEFTTEEFADAVIAEVSKTNKINPAKIYTLSWSSGGPAAYAISLREKSPVRGSFIAMSVYKPETLPPIAKAKGHAYYLYQSPDDKICAFSFAETAKKELEKAGARVSLESYAGGHGWQGDVYGNIKKGIEWLAEPPKAAAGGKK
ncbi:MAG: hypothetical protein HY286_16935 [Planctomycetes bacterium]|nr:hypothetical protein [Planctomycetota bacterium]